MKKLPKNIIENIDECANRMNWWYSILNQYKVPANILDKYHNIIPWVYVSRYQPLTMEDIMLLGRYLIWSDVIDYNCNELNEEDIRILINSFPNNMTDIINSAIRSIDPISEDFLEEFLDFIDWPEASYYAEMSYDFIRKHADILDWDEIACGQELSEDMIEEFADRWNWTLICEEQNLSEELIAQFQDQVDWNNISRYQKISVEFINYFIDNIVWDMLSINAEVCEEVLSEFIDKLNVNFLSSRSDLSEDFVLKHKDKLNIRYVLCYNNNISDCVRKELKNIINKNVVWYYDEAVSYDNTSSSYITYQTGTSSTTSSSYTVPYFTIIDE